MNRNRYAPGLSGHRASFATHIILIFQIEAIETKRKQAQKMLSERAEAGEDGWESVKEGVNPLVGVKRLVK